jgi:hypothetical protein
MPCQLTLGDAVPTRIGTLCVTRWWGGAQRRHLLILILDLDLSGFKWARGMGFPIADCSQAATTTDPRSVPTGRGRSAFIILFSVSPAPRFPVSIFSIRRWPQISADGKNEPGKRRNGETVNRDGKNETVNGRQGESNLEGCQMVAGGRSRAQDS